ncbi:hypothetical protein LXH13_39175 [Streptomyces spinosirectus]|jgi:hypothetical protein|uniref:hypothetical protein n=1 Tax=Streptomyces TaxID=1883 RepID=UPI000FFEA0E1|nr:MULTISPECIES: hypothetical protein [Streptomyces]MBY8346121.1 hypothetical protein [Streptomyces plumbidurans]UIR22695.1 hypothetical protein LXH13_39175 [Streptomyces spinosirectus]
MRTHIAEVPARESAGLAAVTDRAKLADWRRQVVEELMTPSSPYVVALRQTGDMRARADFLDQWRELIAEAVDRLLKSGAPGARLCTSRRTGDVGVDARKIVVLILAALQGGSTLSRIAPDARPLNAALDLALVPVAATEDDFLNGERDDR